jgi:hypothetical protein
LAAIQVQADVLEWMLYLEDAEATLLEHLTSLLKPSILTSEKIVRNSSRRLPSNWREIFIPLLTAILYILHPYLNFEVRLLFGKVLIIFLYRTWKLPKYIGN